jgi:predicted dehydrogenase
MSKVKVGIIGSRFQADCIAHSVKMMPEEAEVVAVSSPTPGNAQAFAERHGIAAHYTDYRQMLKDPAIEMVSITAPNRWHAQMTIDCAAAGKHVVCEKPLCVTLEEADAMLEACAKAGVLLMYAEELFFAPKYVKAKQMADEGAFGRIHLVKQSEKHNGPHSFSKLNYHSRHRIKTSPNSSKKMSNGWHLTTKSSRPARRQLKLSSKSTTNSKHFSPNLSKVKGSSTSIR